MIEIRDARIEDAEDMVAILNPIIAARIYTALDTTLTVEEQRNSSRTFPLRGIFHVAVDAHIRSRGRPAGRLAVRRLHPRLRSRRRHRHIRRSRIAAARASPRSCSLQRSRPRAGRVTKNCSRMCGPTTTLASRPTCARASASSERPSATPGLTVGTSTRY